MNSEYSDGNNFILKTIKRDGVFYAWLQVTADVNVAEKYTVEMTISTISNSATTLIENGKVFPIDMTESMVLRQGEGVMCFGKVMAKKLLPRDGCKFGLKFKISKVEKETK